MADGVWRVPAPVNEPVLSYAPGTPERAALLAEVSRQAGEIVQIPCVVGGREVFTGNIWELRNPSAHREVLAHVHLAGDAEIEAAMLAATDAKLAWSRLPFEERAAIFLRAATLLAGPWRAKVNAATLLGQGKTAHQAEIDSACELIDFWRFNVHYAEQILRDQPPVSAPGTWNRTDHRPLDGFVFAVTPFNFTAIALNLPTAPALVGNTVVWKPATTSALACHHLFRMLRDAGLPDGVINVLHGHGPEVGARVLPHQDLGGVHFTGSTRTFHAMWRTIGEHIGGYRQYPRLVGETGGKDFIVAHQTADAAQVATAIVRGAFEYQGQKCSAASRMYIPSNLWPEVRDRVVADMAAIRQGDPRDLSNFVGPVIDRAAYDRVGSYVDLAHAEATVLAGGTYDANDGWYVAPTLAQVSSPKHRLMREEIFGPVASVWVYEPDSWDELLTVVDRTSPYALTGAVFARDRAVIDQAQQALRHAAGNFYINDKPTGAVVGQQPFGGGRASGTNDKAGSPLNLLRWISPRTLKETFDPPTDWRYPFLG